MATIGELIKCSDLQNKTDADDNPSRNSDADEKCGKGAVKPKFHPRKDPKKLIRKEKLFEWRLKILMKIIF